MRFILNCPANNCAGVGSDPKVILFVTFVDWAKKKFVTDGRKDIWTDRRDGKNSDLDVSTLQMLCNLLTNDTT